MAAIASFRLNGSRKAPSRAPECDGNFRGMLYGYLWRIIDAKKHVYAAIRNSGNVIYVNPEKAIVVAVAEPSSRLFLTGLI